MKFLKNNFSFPTPIQNVYLYVACFVYVYLANKQKSVIYLCAVAYEIDVCHGDYQGVLTLLLKDINQLSFRLHFSSCNKDSC